jgi:protein-S-isoprenylcysteine O-methyltransferase Ste14
VDAPLDNRLISQPLGYATPTAPTPTVWLHYIARVCGVLPLGFGSVIFLLFLIFRATDLAIAGLFTIFGGTCLAFIGLVCAIVFHFQARRAAPQIRQRAQRQALIDGAIIVANFPIAFVMAWIGIGMVSHS